LAPILRDHSFDIVTHSPAQTFQVGHSLGQLLQSGDVVCLQGDLGTGKTCLTQGIGAGLRVEGIISSPTFVFVNEHPPGDTGSCLYHVDLYRIEDMTAAFGLGLEDYMYGDGVTVIEWAERAGELMPRERLWISLGYLDYAKRSLLFQATGEHYVRMLVDLRNALFPRKPGPPAENA
jgi:tRNA threonylcarbamoyladenosine biosynthesis protein TsaE